MVDGEDRADRAADHEADRPADQAGGRHADAGRRGLRRRRGPVRAARAHARPARRPRPDFGPGGPEPRADGHQGGAALVHLLPPVRLPDRPGGRQPGPARRREVALLQGLVRGASSATRRWWRRRSARSRSCKAPFFDQEVVGIERLTELGRRLYGDTDPTIHLLPGAPLHGGPRRRTSSSCRSSCRLP